MNTLIPLKMGKTDAVMRLAEANQLTNVSPWSEALGSTLESLVKKAGPLNNAYASFVSVSNLALKQESIFDASVIRLSSPQHLTNTPASFPINGIENTFSPGLKVLKVPNGSLWNMSECPVILSAEGSSIIEEYSSKYSRLLYFYDSSLVQAQGQALVVDGTALVMADDIRPLNFCHWLVDWLPRLAFLGPTIRRRDFFVLTTPLITEFQRTTLQLCGMDLDRIIEVKNCQVVRARELLVTNDLQRPPHPAFKAAPWAINFLRSHVGFLSVTSNKKHDSGRPQKIYISRGDAAGRRIKNELEFTAALAGFGYVTIELSKIGFVDQVTTFANATHVVAMHGAGLSHVVFLRSFVQVIEIFAATYGTPAFYVLTCGLGNRYSTYVENNVVANSRSQLDDVTIDVEDFKIRCGSIL